MRKWSKNSQKQNAWINFPPPLKKGGGEGGVQTMKKWSKNYQKQNAWINSHLLYKKGSPNYEEMI